MKLRSIVVDHATDAKMAMLAKQKQTAPVLSVSTRNVSAALMVSRTGGSLTLIAGRLAVPSCVATAKSAQAKASVLAKTVIPLMPRILSARHLSRTSPAQMGARASLRRLETAAVLSVGR